MVIIAPSATVSQKFRSAQNFKLSSVMKVPAQAVSGFAFTNDSSRHLNRRSKFPAHDRAARRQKAGNGNARSGAIERAGEADMAFWDKTAEQDGAERGSMTADAFFALGMTYATGQSVPVDFITAHKWFNIAALKGSTEAVRLRREIAAEMSEDDIAAAQRAARDWLRAGEPPVELKAAA